MTQKPDAQSERFKQVGRDLECDQDKARWDERLRRSSRQKPPEKPKP